MLYNAEVTNVESHVHREVARKLEKWSGDKEVRR